MDLLITKKIGRRNYNFNFSGNDLFEVMQESERLSFEDVPCCGLCGSTNLIISSRLAQKKFKYVSIKCLDCRADATMGKTQEDDRTYFIRKKEGGKPGELDWKAFNLTE